jgi:hypothetical protein
MKKQTIAINLDKVLADLSMTRSELAIKLRVHIQTVNRWCAVGAVPLMVQRALNAWLLCDCYGIERE